MAEALSPASPATRLSPRALLAVAAVASLCSLSYEFLIARIVGFLSGQMVTWQGLTIGLYLAALGLGTHRASRVPPGRELERLCRVELWLALLGVLAVPIVLVLHIVYRITLFDFVTNLTRAPGSTSSLLIFCLASQGVTLAIGLLSGYEVPLLIALLEPVHPGRGAARVLAATYVGSLGGTLVFIILLAPRLDLISTGVVVASLNLLLAFFLLARLSSRERLSYPLLLVITVSALIAVVVYGDGLQQVQLKNFYFNQPVSLGPPYFQRILKHRYDVERHLTPYQNIDIVYGGTREDGRPVEAREVTVFLEGHFQFSADTERDYHEFMVHAPIQMTGHIPRRVLVLGAGDGLLLHELLRYGPPLEQVTLVELDPMMLALARSHPAFTRLNQHSLDEARVHVEVGDAFHYVRTRRERYDAIFVDFPYPYSYDAARLYSVEFYESLRKRLEPGGFVVLDSPLYAKSRGTEQTLNTRVISTLKAAGFEQVFPYRSPFRETFLLIREKEEPLDFHLRDLGVRMEVLTPERLEALSRPGFSYEVNGGQVNSIFQPAFFGLRDPQF